MSLVLYPDSDSDQDDTNHAIAAQPFEIAPNKAGKRKRGQLTHDDLPPLPSAFHDLYATNARTSTSDNPSLHGGRKRAIPHVEGNWPSHIYLEWIPSQSESSNLHELIQCVQDAIAQANKEHTKKLAVPNIIPSLESELGAPVPLHISLSRTLQIRTEDKDTFLDTVKSSLQRTAVHSFRIGFRSLRWVSNFDRNRWFLVLSIEKPEHNELNRLLNACNEATEICGHPGLYIGGRGDGPMETNFVNDGGPKRRKSEQGTKGDADRSDRFHISIAWNLEEPDPKWISLIRTIDVSKHIPSPQAAFDATKVRVGNVVHNMDLKAGRLGIDTKKEFRDRSKTYC
ncbi:U6 snRNA phosphodiesterase Usb1 [Phaeosphaeriaceae sp. PMI808]|nr:U6 snRNA phosphodiesterase Usb1 [Phaeosphaeriaceae sp. PMI808]